MPGSITETQENILPAHAHVWSGRLLQGRKSVMPFWSGASHVSGLYEAAHMATLQRAARRK
jgi:hypothetical protein